MTQKTLSFYRARATHSALIGFGTLIMIFAAAHGDVADAQITKSAPSLRVTKAPVEKITVPEKEITPPPSIAVYDEPGSVISKSDSTSAVIRSLRVKRRFSISALRASPIIKLGKTKADMTPVFDNPSSLFNIASRMRSEPALTEVISDDTEVLEVEQGLIIRQFLSYRGKPGACSNSVRRSSPLLRNMRRADHCFTRMTDESRAAAVANPKSPRYIADRSRRVAMLAAATKSKVDAQADIANGLAEFRAMMNNPTRRTQVVAEIGASEAIRLERLTDDQLEAELVNTAEIQIERVMFMPALDELDRQIVRSIGSVSVQKIAFPEKVNAEHALQEQIFLTGFTLGRNKEWHDGVSVSIKWCVIGCKRTYYIKAYAGFDYGFGLRFPIKTGGLYAYNRINNQESASIAPVFEPIDGTTNDFAASGLPGDKLFNGKELVAEFSSYAGMSYKVPFFDPGNVRFDLKKDFTDGLPQPFTNGQFRPPTPGEANPPAAEIIFDNPDLIGGRANFVVVGAKILPAVKVALTSDLLRLKLKDNISGAETQMTNSGQSYPLAVDPRDHSSSFTIGYPEYNLAFQVTPGLNATLFVDVSVWEHEWPWTIWFPQMTVTLPPSGRTFTCHENTVCSRNYRYSPTVVEEEIGNVALPDNEIEAKVEEWARDFRKRWQPKCPQEEIKWCEVAINAVVTTTGNVMVNEIVAVESFPSSDANLIFIKRAAEAEKKAPGIILDGKVRDIERYGKSLVEVYEPAWNFRCMDQLCRDRIHTLTGQFVNALMDRQRTMPKAERNEILFLETTQGNWAGRAKQEVERSVVRVR